MGKTFRMLAGGAAATALTGAMVIVPAVSAHAETGYDRCPASSYCLFSGLDGTGDMMVITANTPDLGSMNDRALSDKNNLPEYIHIWSGTNYSGCSVVTSPAGTGSDHGNFYIDYRNFASSIKIGGPNGQSCGTPPGEDG